MTNITPLEEKHKLSNKAIEDHLQLLRTSKIAGMHKHESKYTDSQLNQDRPKAQMCSVNCNVISMASAKHFKL